MPAKAKDNGGQPNRQLRVSRIQVAVVCDVLEDGRKVNEVMVGVTDESGTHPYTFYDLETVVDWAATFPESLEMLAREGRRDLVQES